MDHEEMRRRLGAARVGRLATVRPDGTPHVVVCCFAIDPDSDTVWTVVDGKPKSTAHLQRVRNLEANPHASLLVDHYDDADWGRLWWVRVDGTATTATGTTVPRPLRDKYAQYRDQPPDGPLITLAIERWTAWSSTARKSSPENL